MYLENGRDIFRGILLLLSAAIAYWVDLTAGIVLVVFMAVMTLQSALTNWCPADLILRPMGLKGKLESKA
ncbi:MAG: YgaP-like transmembrane domain [Chloroflexota bacterium]